MKELINYLLTVLPIGQEGIGSKRYELLLWILSNDQEDNLQSQARATKGHFLIDQPWPLFHLFLVFSNKHQYNFYNNSMWKMSIPSSIWRRDLNPRPLDQESSPITTRPGLLPLQEATFNWKLYSVKTVSSKKGKEDITWFNEKWNSQIEIDKSA